MTLCDNVSMGRADYLLEHPNITAIERTGYPVEIVHKERDSGVDVVIVPESEFAEIVYKRHADEQGDLYDG